MICNTSDVLLLPGCKQNHGILKLNQELLLFKQEKQNGFIIFNLIFKIMIFSKKLSFFFIKTDRFSVDI